MWNPRIGGEKVDPTGNDWYTQGSPPRGRGKAHPGKKSKPGTRITPAWAGKRPRLARSKYPGQDHPRMGGEKPKVL